MNKKNTHRETITTIDGISWQLFDTNIRGKVVRSLQRTKTRSKRMLKYLFLGRFYDVFNMNY